MKNEKQPLTDNIDNNDDVTRPARRAFILSAAVSLPMLMVEAGCGTKPTSPNAAMQAQHDAVAKVDPNLITFTESEHYPLEFAAKGIYADPQGNIYAAGENRLVIFKDGKQLASHPVSGSATAIGGNGADIVLAAGNDIVSFKNGRFNNLFRHKINQAVITAVAQHADKIYVADWSQRLIYCYTISGKLLGTIGAKDQALNYPGIIAPSPHLDVAVSDDGKIHISNPGMHRIEVYSESGKLINTLGFPANSIDGFCGCCNPTDFTITPSGHYVTSEKGIPRVKIQNENGKLTGVVAGPESFASNTMGLDLAVQSDHSILVLDPLKKAIRVFKRNNNA